ncbi:MAG: ASKHA domain-containing protein [Candidatus Methylomirabilales bacterium]
MTEATHRLILMPSGQRGEVPHGSSLLDATARLGIELESICGGRQTCGKCLVEPEFGNFAKHNLHAKRSSLAPPGSAEQEYARANRLDLERQRLGCAAHVLGDVLIHVPDSSLARKQVVRKAASDIEMAVEPAVRQVYVELDLTEMGGPGHWERLQAALAEQWGLVELRLDPVLLPALPAGLGTESATVTLWQEREIIRIDPGYSEGLYGLAVDIGSTTVAAYLCDLRTGELLATEAAMNPQVRYGEDLMSRISYAAEEPQGLDRLHRGVIRAINQLASEAAHVAGIGSRAITDAVVVGNSVMHHLFLGIDPASLGEAPFALAIESAIDLRARELGLDSLHPAARVHLLPCVAGHVGADNAGVLLAEQPTLSDEITLLVDIGTNAEILLGNRQRMLSASSPTGPAFEGAQILHGQRATPGAIERVRISAEGVRYKVVGDDRWNDELQPGDSLRPTGICGSGVIEAVGELFLASLIDSGGLFRSDAHRRHPNVRRSGKTAELVLATPAESATQDEILITQQDIRAIQLAKGALYAGVRLLMDRLAVNQVDQIKLAGAFGSYIDPKYAMVIGLIPDCDLERVESIENAAGDGARIALLSLSQRLAAQDQVEALEYVETALQDHFVAAMALPHASDAFPHLQDDLPEENIAERGRPRRVRARGQSHGESN